MKNRKRSAKKVRRSRRRRRRRRGISKQLKGKILERQEMKVELGLESEIQVGAVKTLSHTDGRSVYFGEAAERAPHPCTFWRNLTGSQMDCRRREVLPWSHTVN